MKNRPGPEGLSLFHSWTTVLTRSACRRQ